MPTATSTRAMNKNAQVGTPDYSPYGQKKEKENTNEKEEKHKTGKNNRKDRGKQDATTKNAKQSATDRQQLRLRASYRSNTADAAIQPTSGAATVLGFEWPYCCRSRSIAACPITLPTAITDNSSSAEWCQCRHRRPRTEYNNDAEQ